MLSRRKAKSWLAVTLLIAWPTALRGADRETQAQKPSLARVEVQSARVDWLPEGGYESLVLTIAGPGDLYVQREFLSGEAPSFGLTDVPNGRFPDGTYAYELRAVPREDKDARENVGAQERDLVQTGQLWVEGGIFKNQVQALPERKPPLGSSLAQTVLSDDLVVQGYACIGLDCEDGDADVQTLKLKDLFDTRITFDNSGCCHPSVVDWALQANDFSNSNGDFTIRDLTSGTIPLRVSHQTPTNTLTLLGNGNVGVGTSTPATHLHVLGSAGTNKVLVEEASGTAAARELLEIRNKGGSFLIWEDTTVPERWGNGCFGSNFLIDNQANSGVEFTFGNTGNLTITGTLTQGSSRDLKTDFASLDPRDVLSRVSALPVSLWSYKTESSVRHVGPMAEDFHRSFGLGEDDKHIAPGDQSGIALLAVQGLNQVVAEKDADIDELKSRIASLEKLVDRLIQDRVAAEAQR